MFSPSNPISLRPPGSIQGVRGQKDTPPPSTCEFLPTLSSPGSKTDKQPTYTTVGSVYNPHATPLQPPTRRGRSSRYQFYHSPSGDLTTEMAPNILASLRDPTSGSPRTPGRIPLYSPLQQNYDRATTPAQDKENTQIDNIRMATPGMRSGNVPASPFRAAIINPNDDPDTGKAEDALAARFNVKGLTNLASYPNPMQQTARKALAKARNANIGPARAETPSSLHYNSTDIAKEPQALGSFSVTPLSTSLGAPQPLTAGPPGQRQYKPSTFEGAIKALGESTSSPNIISSTKPRDFDTLPFVTRIYGDHSDEISAGPVEAIWKRKAVMTGYATPAVLGMRFTRESMNDGCTPQESFVSEAKGDKTLERSTQTNNIRELSQRSCVAATTDSRRPIEDTEGPETIQKYYPRGLPRSYQGSHHIVPTDWMKHYPLNQQMAKSTHKTKIERESKVNEQFYGGTSKLGGSNSVASTRKDGLEDIVLAAFNHATGENVPDHFGRVISIGHDRDVHYQHMTIDEANEVDDAIHTEPLLNMLFSTLLGYVGYGESEIKWHRGFVQADAGLVDSTEGGNLSLFSSPNNAGESEKAFGSRRVPHRRRTRRSTRTTDF